MLDRKTAHENPGAMALKKWGRVVGINAACATKADLLSHRILTDPGDEPVNVLPQDQLRPPEWLTRGNGKTSKSIKDKTIMKRPNETAPTQDRPTDKALIVPVLQPRKASDEFPDYIPEEAFSEYITEPYSDELMVVYVEVEDALGVGHYLKPSDVAPLKLDSPGELRKLACGNLTKRLVNPHILLANPHIQRYPGFSGERGLYVIHDRFAASLMLLDEFWDKAKLEVSGEIVVAAPTPCTLCVTGSQNADGIRRVKAKAESIAGDEFGRLMFVRRQGRFVPYAPESEDESSFLQVPDGWTEEEDTEDFISRINVDYYALAHEAVERAYQGFREALSRTLRHFGEPTDSAATANVQEAIAQLERHIQAHSPSPRHFAENLAYCRIVQADFSRITKAYEENSRELWLRPLTDLAHSLAVAATELEDRMEAEHPDY